MRDTATAPSRPTSASTRTGATDHGSDISPSVSQSRTHASSRRKRPAKPKSGSTNVSTQRTRSSSVAPSAVTAFSTLQKHLGERTYTDSYGTTDKGKYNNSVLLNDTEKLWSAISDTERSLYKASDRSAKSAKDAVSTLRETLNGVTFTEDNYSKFLEDASQFRFDLKHYRQAEKMSRRDAARSTTRSQTGGGGGRSIHTGSGTKNSTGRAASSRRSTTRKPRRR